MVQIFAYDCTNISHQGRGNPLRWFIRGKGVRDFTSWPKGKLSLYLCFGPGEI